MVLDNLVYGHEWAVKWGPFELGDIGDPQRVREVLEKYNPECVMHFAAFAYVGESVTNPMKYYHNNLSNTLVLLQQMLQCGIDKFIFSSTCATYGVPENIPLAEDHIQAPINPYGSSKLMVENILRDYGHAYGLKATCLRYFNAAGADPDGEIGEDHNPETHLIPIVLDAALGKRDCVYVFGDDYDTPDGTCVRDYIHINDIVSAHIQCMESLGDHENFSFYNLGNGKGFSVNEIITAAKEVTGKKIRTIMEDRRPGDPPKLIGDTSKIRRELGWAPKIPGIHDIISTAWNWHKSHHFEVVFKESQ